MDIYERTLLPGGLEVVVEGELYEDERVKWTGQPKASRLVWKALPAVLFGIPWTAFALFWTWGAGGGMGEEGFKDGFNWFGLFGVPFILIGFGMLSSPIWVYRKAKKTVYVVTDRRAIIFEKGFSVQIRSFEGQRLGEVTKRVRADGSGDIVFECGIKRSRGDNNSGVTEIGFFGIERVNEVEDMVKVLAEQSSQNRIAER